MPFALWSATTNILYGIYSASKKFGVFILQIFTHKNKACSRFKRLLCCTLKKQISSVLQYSSLTVLFYNIYTQHFVQLDLQTLFSNVQNLNCQIVLLKDHVGIITMDNNPQITLLPKKTLINI